MKRTILFSDGSCLGNHQPDPTKRMMVAVVTDSSGGVLIEKHEHGGSNNIAELWAVREGLAWAAENGCNPVEIRCDSKNTLAWAAGRIGQGLNDREAVLELYESIMGFRQNVHLDLVWVPRASNLAGQYIEQNRRP